MFSVHLLSGRGEGRDRDWDSGSGSDGLSFQRTKE